MNLQEMDITSLRILLVCCPPNQYSEIVKEITRKEAKEKLSIAAAKATEIRQARLN